MAEPGLYWAYSNVIKDAPEIVVMVTTVGKWIEFDGCELKKAFFTLGPRIPSAEEIEGWQDWPTCPECHFPLVRHVEGEPSHENIFWTCPEHGEFLVKQRYRVIER